MTAGAPHSLRCEYATDPMGIGSRWPRFFWQLGDSRPGALQCGYHLLVASSAERLDGDEGDLWDQRADSGDSIQVVYTGESLASRQRGFWKVRSFDAAGEASSWSQVASFEIGLLERAEWSADWIASPLIGARRTPAVVPALRRSFRMDRPVARARLYITALGLYQIQLNGRRVGDHELAPGWTDYTKRVRYQVFDVAEQLRRGENALGALLGDGWYCGQIGLVQEREYYGRRPALLAQLEVFHPDGSQTRVVTDAGWRWHRSSILSADLMQGEVVDARQDLGAFSLPDYDDGAWHPVDVIADPGIQLDAMSGPPVRALHELRPVGDPVAMRGGSFGGRFIYDLGQNMVGRVRLSLSGAAGTTVSLRHAEMLDERGDLYTANLKDASATDVFTLRGSGEPEVFEPRFTFHGFRYVEVRGRLDPSQIQELVGVVLHSDCRPTGRFSCSDPDLDQLQSNIVWGQRGNWVDVPTDCPQRDERLGWTGDAQVFIRTACFNMEVPGFFAKWLVDLRDTQGEDGKVPPVAPVVFLDRIFPDGGPAWADAAVICPWTLYRCYGDSRLLEESWESMRAFVDEIGRRFPKGIRSDPAIDWWGGFGDWVALDGTDPRDSRIGGTRKDLIGTAFYAHSAELLSRIADRIERPDDRQRYGELAARIRDVFRRRFVTGDGLVSGNTQTGYVLALHFDLLEPEQRAINVEALARDLQARGSVQLTTGFVGTPYLLPVLTRFGRLDLAYKLLLRREFPSWLYPVVTGGATTIWERWDGWTREKGFFDPEMNSFNHYAYGSVGEWLYGTLAGLDLDPGDPPAWRRARIAPRPPVHPNLPAEPLLTRASASLETLYGSWSVGWEIEDDVFRCEVSVPPHTSASLRMPDASEREIGAGEHRFEASLASILEIEESWPE